MTSYMIAVCSECGWTTVPQWEGHIPACANCLRKSRKGQRGGSIVTVGDMKTAKRCRVIEVVPKNKPFSKRKMLKKITV